MRTKRFLISMPLLLGLGLYLSWGELVWWTTQLSDTPEAYATFAKRHPTSRHIGQALLCLDEQEWRLTQSFAGVLGYENYLERLPNGPHADEARAGLQRARLDEALAEGTLEAIEAHAELFPGDLRDPRVQALFERLEWRRVFGTESSAVLAAFLERFPEGLHAQQARDKYHLIRFQEVALTRNITKLQDYITSDPPEAHLREAQLRLDELYWEELSQAGSISSIRYYIQNSIQTHHLDEARDLLEGLLWESALELDRPAAIKAYMQEFPAGLYLGLAQARLDDLAWARALASGTLRGLENYLAEFPDGSHVVEIPIAQEQMFWSLAQSQDQLETYEAYLERFPEGLHSPAAQQAMLGRSVLDALELGQLSIRLLNVNQAFLELELELNNQSDSAPWFDSTTIEFPAGLIFEAGPAGLADLVVSRAKRLRVAPGRVHTLRLQVVAVGGAAPGSLEHYSLPRRVDQNLSAILTRAGALNASVNALQVALLVGVDDWDFDALTSLRGAGGQPIKFASIAEGLQLCLQLNLDLSKQRIWQDRVALCAQLPKGPLHTWLSRPESLGDALRLGNASHVGKLLEAGADPNQTGVSAEAGLAPLGLALGAKRIDLAKLLLQAGADPNQAYKGESLLALAVSQGSTESVRLLLEAGAKPDWRAGSKSELALAAATGQVEVIDLLLEAGAKPDGPGELEIPLNRAAETGQLASLRRLIERGASIDLGIDSALNLAAAGGHLGVLLTLIDAGAQVDRPGESGRTALHQAVEQGQMLCIRALLRSGADLNRDAEGFRPIDLAAFRSPGLAQTLRDEGAQESIFSAVASGDLDGIERSLARGESLERWGIGGHRPLHLAVRMRQDEAMERLLNHRADTHARTLEGFQPLHWAVRMAWPEAILELVQHGADLNDASPTGTPLQLAVAAGDLASVELLLELGADPAWRGGRATTVLAQAQEAARNDPTTFAPIVKLLEN